MISITLPSNDLPRLTRTMENIAATTLGEYEVIVVSPKPPLDIVAPWGRLIWLCEQEPKGPNAAHALAFNYARGEWITAWVDDHLYTYGWDREVLSDIEDRDKSIGTLCLGLRATNVEHVGTVFGIYYPYFPFMKRWAALNITGWITGGYRKGFADCDLGLRLWSGGHRCEWSRKQVIVRHDDDARKGSEVNITDEDYKNFVRVWGQKYGHGYDLTHLRGFNRDVIPNPDERTIYNNACPRNDLEHLVK